MPQNVGPSLTNFDNRSSYRSGATVRSRRSSLSLLRPVPRKEWAASLRLLQRRRRRLQLSHLPAAARQPSRHLVQPHFLLAVFEESLAVSEVLPDRSECVDSEGNSTRVDSRQQVARQTRRRLSEHGVLPGKVSEVSFFRIGVSEFCPERPQRLAFVRNKVVKFYI